MAQKIELQIVSHFFPFLVDVKFKNMIAHQNEKQHNIYIYRYIYIYIYIPAKPKTQEFQGQFKITGYLDAALEISRLPWKFGFWG